ncbi:hypothetical protein JCM10212_002453 [Sporobolomyces blumeae]
MPWWSSDARCIDSGNRDLHARLIGGNVVLNADVAPSAVLAVVFLLSIAVTGIAFAIRAGIANAQSAVAKATIAVEQALFSTGQLVLLGSSLIYTKVFVSRATLIHWPSTATYLGIAILVVSFILDCVSWSRLPDPPTTFSPPKQYNQMRVASAVLTFVVATFNAVFLPVAKVFAPFLPLLELALVDLAAWFLWVPAFYVFCIATITVDTSDLVCSAAFYYVAFGLFPFLALAVLLSLPQHRWGFSLAPHDLASGVPYPAAPPVVVAAHTSDPILDFERHDAEMAAVEAELAARDEEIERRLLERELHGHSS